MKYPLYEKAKKLLMSEYEHNLQFVRGSRFHELFMREKIEHSFQVSGAGNGILAHEKYFQDKDAEFLDIVRTAVLLHDIYRFRETRGWFETGQKVDHSVLGAELLQGIKDFDNILITLPIKHHGHMIEDFYADAEYQKQDEQTKEKLKNIIFAVRDADKIANWYLLSRHWTDIQTVWLYHPEDFSEEQAKINDELWGYFVRHEVGPRNTEYTNAEVLLATLCWLFDINYTYSIDFCKKLNVFNNLYDVLRQRRVSESKIKDISQIIKNFVFETFKIQI